MAVAAAVLAAGGEATGAGPASGPGDGGPELELEYELQFQQVETSTRPCTMLEHVADALADAGDLAVVTGLAADVSRRGNGASFQRDAFRRTGLMRDVVRGAARRSPADRADWPGGLAGRIGRPRGG